MLLKEAEAKRRYCHLTMPNPDKPYRCIGSECMAWCWVDLPYDVQRTPLGMKPKSPEWSRCGHKDGWIQWKRNKATADRLGACGSVSRQNERYVVLNDPIFGFPMSPEDMEPMV